MALIPFGSIAFLMFAFSSAFVGAVCAAFGVTRLFGAKRRNVLPILGMGLLALTYASLVCALINLAMARRLISFISPFNFQIAVMVALVGMTVATAVVARIGLARQILGSSYLATALSVFILPFVGRSTSLLYEMPGLMAAYVPAALGMAFSAGIVWARQRDREAYASISFAPDTTSGTSD